MQKLEQREKREREGFPQAPAGVSYFNSGAPTLARGTSGPPESVQADESPLSPEGKSRPLGAARSRDQGTVSWEVKQRSFLSGKLRKGE